MLMCTVSFITVILALLAAKWHNLSGKGLAATLLQISTRMIPTQCPHTHASVCDYNNALTKHWPWKVCVLPFIILLNHSWTKNLKLKFTLSKSKSLAVRNDYALTSDKSQKEETKCLIFFIFVSFRGRKFHENKYKLLIILLECLYFVSELFF